RRPVLDRALYGAVDLLRSEEHDGSCRHRTGRIDRDSHGDRALVVGEVGDAVHVVLTEPEIEALERPTDALYCLRDRGPAGRSAFGLQSLDALRRERRLDEVLGHLPTPPTGSCV